MRIIAGRHRGRPIVAPADATTTRPITDRVKQSLFDRLASAGRIEGAKVADIFAGTGSLGLECLSRGAERVWFIERDRDAITRLRQNLEAYGETASASVLSLDALSPAVIAAMPAGAIDLIFFDPPYAMVQEPGTMQRCADQVGRLATIAAEDAMLIWRTPVEIRPGALDGWGEAETHAYGSMALHFYRRAMGHSG